MNARQPTSKVSAADGYQEVTVCRVENGQRTDAVDHVATEVAVALVFNGISHAVMLASPLDLEDFAIGFSLTEGIVDRANQIYDVQVETSSQGFTVELNIASECFARLKEKRRNLTGRTGCGLCGTESLDQVLRPLQPVNVQLPITVNAITRALLDLPSHQLIQSVTGATHAAAWFDRNGSLKCIREDVGRHNALDKLIGAGVQLKGVDQTDWQQALGFMVVTSRASMEMVQKTVAAGFSVLVAVSAPTQMAIDMSNRFGVTLIGFARPQRLAIYTGFKSIVVNVSDD
jgi:FdhD protein